MDNTFHIPSVSCSYICVSLLVVSIIFLYMLPFSAFFCQSLPHNTSGSSTTSSTYFLFSHPRGFSTYDSYSTIRFMSSFPAFLRPSYSQRYYDLTTYSLIGHLRCGKIDQFLTEERISNDVVARLSTQFSIKIEAKIFCGVR